MGVLPPNGEFHWIGKKMSKGVQDICDFLKKHQLQEDDVRDAFGGFSKNADFKILMDRLCADLQGEHGLKAIESKQRVELKTKAFDFEESVRRFFDYKNRNTSKGHSYVVTLQDFWLPFFLNKCGCVHPSEFIDFFGEAEEHLLTAKKADGEPYSRSSLPSMAVSLHEYLHFLTRPPYKLLKKEKHLFKLEVGMTLEEQKRGRTSKSRKQDTYSLQDLFAIKAKIDKRYVTTKELKKSDPARYNDNLKWKLRAYGVLVGVYSGIRRGNLIPMKAKDLHPQDKRPHFVVRDNVVSGWSRGISGSVLIEMSTKATSGEAIKMPLVQPDVDTFKDVLEFLVEHKEPEEFLLPSERDVGTHCSLKTPAKWWQAIGKECGFKFLSPHDWKHSYATIGGQYLDQMYNGNPRALQFCCLHEKFETTLAYIRNKADSILELIYKKSVSKVKEEAL